MGKREKSFLRLVRYSEANNLYSARKIALFSGWKILLFGASQTVVQGLAGYTQMHGSDGLVAVRTFQGFRNQYLFRLFERGQLLRESY